MKLKELLSKLYRNYFYLMHLSYDGQYREELWQYACKNNLIGLDLRRVDRDWRTIRQHSRLRLTKVWYQQFKLFCEIMQVGDCVVVTDGMKLSHLLGVALVKSDYTFEKEYWNDFFRHVRRVEWLVKYNYEDRPPIKKAYFRRTLLRIDQGRKQKLWRIVNCKIDVKLPSSREEEQEKTPSPQSVDNANTIKKKG